jgi:hypothetical protein
MKILVLFQKVSLQAFPIPIKEIKILVLFQKVQLGAFSNSSACSNNHKKKGSLTGFKL